MPVSPHQRLAGRRLRAPREFARLKTQGKRLAVGCLLLNWSPAPDSGRSRVGVITSKRIGHAVLRNRARRVLREAFRRFQHELAGPTDLVLVARNSIVGREQAAVDRDYREALRRAGLLGTGAATLAGSVQP